MNKNSVAVPTIQIKSDLLRDYISVIENSIEAMQEVLDGGSMEKSGMAELSEEFFNLESVASDLKLLLKNK